MKALILAALITMVDVIPKVQNINGRLYFWVHNNTNREIYCYVSSDYGYFEFIVPEKSSSRSYPVDPKYAWACS